MEYGSSQAANTARKSMIECKKCKLEKKLEIFDIQSKRVCPLCNKTISYKTVYIARTAEKKGLCCISCSKKSENYSGLKRNCPLCKKEMMYKTSDAVTSANKFNRNCKSCSLKGKPPSQQCLDAVSSANTGRKLSKEHIEKIKNKNTGLKRSQETKDKISKAMIGRKYSAESIKKMQESAIKKDPPSDLIRIKMSISQYKRYGIENRDEAYIKKQLYISGLKTWASRAKAKIPFCEECGKKEDLHAHHIKPKCIYPEFALDPSNAKILCKECHIDFHKNNLYNKD
jgi:5-methylcytosine-specific restriction endonuclease McrA